MKNKAILIVIILIALLGITGFVVYATLRPAKQETKTTINETPTPEAMPTVDPTVVVTLEKSKTKDNTVKLSISGLVKKYMTIGYELSYDSQGLIKGVNSGSKPLDVANKESFDREVYLGTCSKNDCKPDVGVKKVSIVLEFTDATGVKSQFTKDFDL